MSEVSEGVFDTLGPWRLTVLCDTCLVLVCVCVCVYVCVYVSLI